MTTSDTMIVNRARNQQDKLLGKRLWHAVHFINMTRIRMWVATEDAKMLCRRNATDEVFTSGTGKSRFNR